MKKKEKVLIFRSAKMWVVDSLMKQIGKSCDVTFLVQPIVEKEIRNKYPFAEIISIRDSHFEYESFFKNVRLDEKYDTVYILSAGEFFWRYEEIFLIADKIKCQKLVMFNGKGERNVELQNFRSAVMNYVFFLIEKIIAFWYRNFGKKYKF